MAAGFRQSVEALSKAMLHPFLSRMFDDQLSVLLIRSSTSLAWNIVASGAFLSFLAVLLAEPADSVVVNILIGYAVIGGLWGAFAALAHSAYSGCFSLFGRLRLHIIGVKRF